MTSFKRTCSISNYSKVLFTSLRNMLRWARRRRINRKKRNVFLSTKGKSGKVSIHFENTFNDKDPISTCLEMLVFAIVIVMWDSFAHFGGKLSHQIIFRRQRRHERIWKQRRQKDSKSMCNCSCSCMFRRETKKITSPPPPDHSTRHKRRSVGSFNDSKAVEEGKAIISTEGEISQIFNFMLTVLKVVSVSASWDNSILSGGSTDVIILANVPFLV